MRDSSELWKEALEKARTPRKLPAAFRTIQVSGFADELIEAHKQAAFACGAAETREQMNVAYSHLSVVAESLYSYIEHIQASSNTGATPLVNKRF